MDNQTANNNLDNLPENQRHYVQVLSNKKMAYGNESKLQNLATDLMAKGMFNEAQAISQAAQSFGRFGHHFTATQKAIEAQHPEFREDAIKVAKNRQRARQQNQILQM